MILSNYVKQCKKCVFYLGKGGGFHVFLVIGQPNAALPSKKKIIKTFVFWDAS